MFPKGLLLLSHRVCAVCVDRIPDVSCTNTTPQVAYANGTCYNDTELIGVWNETVFESSTHLKRTSASEEYYKYDSFRHYTDGACL